ncbi:MAG: hypothetical protein K0Q62_1603, partial [Phenylobacterium sp.]|jgi:hypothetical protein|nr:hypothetical protein [Phenylobacterium sp.]
MSHLLENLAVSGRSLSVEVLEQIEQAQG